MVPVGLQFFVSFEGRACKGEEFAAVFEEC